jgi:GTPase SAR1 family protein
VESFRALEQWIKDAKEFAKPSIQIIVVGNKIDLEEQRLEMHALCLRNKIGVDGSSNRVLPDT